MLSLSIFSSSQRISVALYEGKLLKRFFEKTIKSKNLEARDDNTYINNEERTNYLFNSHI